MNKKIMLPAFLLSLIALSFYLKENDAKSNFMRGDSSMAALAGDGEHTTSPMNRKRATWNERSSSTTPARAVEISLGAAPTNENEELTQIEYIRSRPNWKKNEQYLFRKTSLLFASYLAELQLPDVTKDEVHALILELYSFHTQSEIRAIDAKLQESLGQENYATFKNYTQEISQQSFDKQLVKEYLTTRPIASIEETNTVSQIISQIQISKAMLPIIEQEAVITEAQITELMNQYDASFAAATTSNPLEASALAALKQAFEIRIKNDIRKALLFRTSR
jgi:hypothetical protein